MRRDIVVAMWCVSVILSPFIFAQKAKRSTATSETSESPAPVRRSYRVRSGDTLESIAERFLGRRDRWIDILAINPKLKDPNRLTVDEELELPLPGERIEYHRSTTATSGSDSSYPSTSGSVASEIHLPSASVSPTSPAPVIAEDIPPTVVSSVVPTETAPPVSQDSASTLPWASWNSITQSKDDGSVVEAPLEIGQKYDVRFDLTLGAIGTKINSTVDPNAKDILRRLKGKHPTLFAVPVLSGDELKLLTGTPPLAFPLDPQRLESGEPRKNGESDLDYLRRISAATITIPVHAVNAGCAFLGLSLWTATDDNLRPNTPFDFILRRVPVGDGPSRCGEVGLLQSGLPASFINRAGVTVDASLHIFQLPTGAPQGQPQRYSQAVYVDLSGKPLTWRLAADLASYVAEPKTYLSRQLHWALQLNDYRPMRAELTKIIFPSTDDAAVRALNSMKALAARADSRPVTVYASLVGDDGWPQVFPIGLVNGDDEKALGSRITFVEPLKQENTADARCVSRWTFFLPPKLLPDNGFACSVNDAELLKETVPSHTGAAEANADVGQDLSTIMWNRLMIYFGVEKQAQNAAANKGVDGDSPEGLLLLAHQGNGVLSFNPDGEPGIKSLDVHHPKYQAGSMGVLVACEGSSSGAASADLDWLTTFNKLNMDVILVSPFSLPIGVGGCFARRWRAALEEARKNPTPVTIAEIYRSVLKQMAAELTEADDQEVLNAAYQFVLTGNAQLPVCGSTP